MHAHQYHIMTWQMQFLPFTKDTLMHESCTPVCEINVIKIKPDFKYAALSNWLLEQNMNFYIPQYAYRMTLFQFITSGCSRS